MTNSNGPRLRGLSLFQSVNTFAVSPLLANRPWGLRSIRRSFPMPHNRALKQPGYVSNARHSFTRLRNSPNPTGEIYGLIQRTGKNQIGGEGQGCSLFIGKLGGSDHKTVFLLAEGKRQGDWAGLPLGVCSE
jgi:hypothetical protein